MPCGEGFSSHYGFRRQPWAVRALDYALAMAFAVGPRRLVSTPSRKGLARRCLGQTRPGSSPTLTGFTQALSSLGAQFSKSLVSTNFTTRADARILPECVSRA